MSGAIKPHMLLRVTSGIRFRKVGNMVGFATEKVVGVLGADNRWIPANHLRRIFSGYWRGF